jgi:hypothetical protein
LNPTTIVRPNLKPFADFAQNEPVRTTTTRIVWNGRTVALKKPKPKPLFVASTNRRQGIFIWTMSPYIVSDAAQMDAAEKSWKQQTTNDLKNHVVDPVCIIMATHVSYSNGSAVPFIEMVRGLLDERNPILNLSLAALVASIRLRYHPHAVWMLCLNGFDDRQTL